MSALLKSGFRVALLLFRSKLNFTSRNRSRVRVHPELELPIISRLSTVLVEKILLFLNVTDSIRCRLVCRQWRRILNKRLTLHFQLTGETLKAFRKSRFQPSKLTVMVQEVLMKRFAINKRNQIILNRVNELRLSGSKKPIVPVITRSQCLRLPQMNHFGKGLWNIINACRNVHVLILDLENIQEKVRLSWNPHFRYGNRFTLENLHTFEVKISIQENGHLLMQLLCLRAPCVQKLAIEPIKTPKRVQAFRMKCVNFGIFRFIACHSKTLKVLRISVLLTTGDYVPCDKLEFSDEVDIKSSLSKLQLLELGIDYVEAEGQETNWAFLDCLLRGQRSLETLSVSTNSRKLIGNVYLILANNAQTLRKLYLRLIGRSGANFDAHWLQFSKLTDVSICMDRNSNAELINPDKLPNSIETLYWNAPMKYFPLPKSRNISSKSHCLYNLKKLVMVQPSIKKEIDAINKLVPKLLNSFNLNQIIEIKCESRGKAQARGKLYQFIKGLNSSHASTGKFPSTFHILPRDEDVLEEDDDFGYISYEAI